MSKSGQAFVNSAGKRLLLGPHGGVLNSGVALSKGADCGQCDADKTPCFFIVTITGIVLCPGCIEVNYNGGLSTAFFAWDGASDFNGTFCLSRMPYNFGIAGGCAWYANLKQPLGIGNLYISTGGMGASCPPDLNPMTGPYLPAATKWYISLDNDTTPGFWRLRIVGYDGGFPFPLPAGAIVVFEGTVAMPSTDCTTPGFSISNLYTVCGDSAGTGTVGPQNTALTTGGTAAVSQTCQPCFCIAPDFNDDFAPADFAT